MLGFKFSIGNPWAKAYANDKNLFNWHKTFFKDKCLEIEVGRWGSYDIFKIDFDLSWRGGSHAGPRFNICILRYSFEISYYDSRHWDYDKGTWEKYDEN